MDTTDPTFYVTTRTRWELDYDWTPEITGQPMPETSFLALQDQAIAEGWTEKAYHYPACWEYEKRDDDTGLYDYMQISYDPYRNA